jgi:hypothetical protein
MLNFDEERTNRIHSRAVSGSVDIHIRFMFASQEVRLRSRR